MATRINLLPLEYRKKEMTPIVVLLPLLSAITLIVAVAFYWSWLRFGELSTAKGELEELTALYDSKKPRLNYLDALKSEEDDYRNRAQTIETIAASRILWTRKLDELCDVVAKGKGGDSYLVWLHSLEAKPQLTRGRRGKGPPPGPRVEIEGLSFSDDDALRAFNNFHEVLTGSDFYLPDFVSINKPAGKSVEMDDEFTPRKAWTIKLSMDMKGLDASEKRSVQASRGSRGK
jgi:Tfp pilus assembly protein PilN